ncbi:MAG: hypothetical protein D3M94_09245 [Rhodocyclales bacterium GT-UBC]|nr:MAG: hypothetical protein D3M94_09245 [Rhodocyclales bacterium GT-UBC]
MSKSQSKWHSGRIIEASLYLIEGAAAFGLLSGAAVVAAVGKFLLGGMLGVLGLGVLARMSRRTRTKASPRRKTET